jgi:hypothetical protein
MLSIVENIPIVPNTEFVVGECHATAAYRVQDVRSFRTSVEQVCALDRRSVDQRSEDEGIVDLENNKGRDRKGPQSTPQEREGRSRS